MKRFAGFGGGCWVVLWVVLVMEGGMMVVVAQEKNPLREWTSSQGKTVQASLVSFEGSEVKLRLKNGRLLVVQPDQLSAGDRGYLDKMKKVGRDFEAKEMPEETRIELPVVVEGRDFEFKTPHFIFVSESKVGKSFISEAAKVFEGTYQAIVQLPLGLNPRPPGGDVKFRARFMYASSFQQEIANYITVEPGMKVAGVYLPKRKKIWVPYDSIGAVEKGGQMTLRRTSDTSTLIHEITHQMMHDWLVLTPLWFTEGMAEYMASVPYQNGRFEFKNSTRGLKERLKGKYAGMTLRMISPDDLSDPDDEGAWKGTMEDYLSAMLWVHYFVRMDRGGQGEAVAAYLKLMGRAKTDTNLYIDEYNAAVKEFEVKREKFNREVDAYNAAGKTLLEERKAYNERIKKYNQQVADGVAEGERIEVGEKPTMMQAPKKLVVPEILKTNTDGGPIDVFAIANARAKPALMSERDAKKMREDVGAAYAEIGLKVFFAEPR
ncbi:MAG: DUF1570 domain-containing protein [Verrucomicrobiales bacterium]|nr:DUF1570 domain-containing protein [Verrucomicrobiales bacterium]